jgi:hypothetical protein
MKTSQNIGEKNGNNIKSKSSQNVDRHAKEDTRFVKVPSIR